MKKGVLFLSLLLLATADLSAQTLLATDVRSLPQQVKDSITAVRLTGHLTTDGNSDFRQMRDVCGQLASVDLTEAACCQVPDNAFFAASQLQHIRLPQSLKHIGRYAFFRCVNLRDTLVIPQGVETIGEAAFQGCNHINHLQLPSSLRRIESWAFSRLLNLRDTLSVPEGVQAIGQGAFSSCIRVLTVVLPSTIDTIEAEAFSRMTNLRLVRVEAKVPPALSPSAFSDYVYRKAVLEVPEGSEEAYRQAPGWCRFFGQEVSTTVVPVDSFALIPYPAKVEALDEPPLVWNTLPLLAGAGMFASEYECLNTILEKYTDYSKPSGATSYLPCLFVDDSLAEEAYKLEISGKGLRITGGSSAGIFYGIMTLRQILISGITPNEGRCLATSAVTIEDAPRLVVRELMIDPARTFLPISQIEDFIREMAYLKYNTLQLHLCDDQAWRVEIKAYPELTALSSHRVAMDDMHRESAGFYTQAELRELVRFAERWHVTLVPEIEMPGHQTAAFHALPWLTCDSTRRLPLRETCGVANELLCPARESTYQFLGTVFRELCSIFPGDYIHLGGDEAGNPSLGAWTGCADCQQLALRLGAKADGTDNWRLQEYLFGRIIDTLQTTYHKTPMFWYETDFKHIPDGCVTYAWRHGLTAQAIDAAVQNAARIILCPGEHCYLDYPMAKGDMPEVNWGMPITSLQQVYAFDPNWGKGETFERETLLGVAGTLWSECMPESPRLFYMALPRILALAEVAWTPQQQRSYNDFHHRLQNLQSDFYRRGVPFSNCY